jgi:hypothetical protein
VDTELVRILKEIIIAQVAILTLDLSQGIDDMRDIRLNSFSEI